MVPSLDSTPMGPPEPTLTCTLRVPFDRDKRARFQLGNRYTSALGVFHRAQDREPESGGRRVSARRGRRSRGPRGRCRRHEGGGSTLAFPTLGESAESSERWTCCSSGFRAGRFAKQPPALHGRALEHTAEGSSSLKILGARPRERAGDAGKRCCADRVPMWVTRVAASALPFAEPEALAVVALRRRVVATAAEARAPGALARVRAPAVSSRRAGENGYRRRGFPPSSAHTTRLPTRRGERRAHANVPSATSQGDAKPARAAVRREMRGQAATQLQPRGAPCCPFI